MDYFIHNTYIVHYKTAEHLFQSAQNNKEGQFYNLLSSISFCAFTIEAYINHLGNIEEEKEWENWDKTKHPNLADKMKRLSKKCNFEIDFEDNVFSYLSPLLIFRNIVVHGRTEYIQKNIKKPQNNTKGALLDLSSEIEKLCTLKKAEKYLSITKEIIEIFNSNSTDKLNKSRLFSLGNGSFKVKRT